MPNFDRLAMASLTPGGAQAGVNDIVAAIMNADAQKAKDAQVAKAQAAAQSMDQARLGETIRANMANEGLKGSDMAGDSAFRDRSLGETIRHNMADEALGGKNYHGDPMLAEQRGMHNDWENANITAGLDPSGAAWVDKTSYDPLDIGHEHPTVSKVKGPPSADIEAKRQEEFKKLRAARAQGSVTAGLMPQGPIDPKTATAPVSPAAPSTPAPLGPPANARQPLDYEALDAKFQAQSPTYRQKRADPSFDWKKFLDARAPR